MWIYILVLLLFPYLMASLLLVDIVPVFSSCSLLYRSETGNSFPSNSLVRCFEFIAERVVHNSWWWQVGWDKLETKLGGWPTGRRYCSRLVRPVPGAANTLPPTSLLEIELKSNFVNLRSSLLPFLTFAPPFFYIYSKCVFFLAFADTFHAVFSDSGTVAMLAVLRSGTRSRDNHGAGHISGSSGGIWASGSRNPRSKFRGAKLKITRIFF